MKESLSISSSSTSLRWSVLEYAPPHAGRPITAHQAYPQAAQEEALVRTRTPGDMLHDNEIVIMMVRPSLWYIPAVSARFISIIILAALLIDRTRIAGHLLDSQSIWAVTAILVSVRLVYALINWTSQLYLLTNHRIVTIRGAVNVEMFQVGLCRISEARLIQSPAHQLLRVGDIGFATGGDILPQSIWFWIAHPQRVQRQIQQALQKRGG